MPFVTSDLTAQPAPANAPVRGRQAPARPLNACQNCGATSYRTIIERDGQGEMKPSGRYACTGCKRVFSEIDEWRGLQNKGLPAA